MDWFWAAAGLWLVWQTGALLRRRQLGALFVSGALGLGLLWGLGAAGLLPWTPVTATAAGLWGLPGCIGMLLARLVC